MSLEVDPDTGLYYVRAGPQRLRLECEDLDNEMRERAMAELREYPDTVEASIRELKKMLAAESDLLVPIDDEKFLMKFLRPCKFYPESALEKMKLFYMFKKKYPSYCENLIPSKNRSALDHSLITMQETRDQNGSRILTIYTGTRWNPSEVSLGDLFRGIQLGLEGAMLEPRTQVGGVVVILNMIGFSLTHAVQITPSFAKMAVDWIQDCIPVRLKAVHVVNQPYIFNMVYALFKPFLREKLKRRIHFHGSNFDSLKRHVPADALKPEFKGCMDLPEIPGHLLGDVFCKFEDDFKLSNTFGYKNKGC